MSTSLPPKPRTIEGLKRQAKTLKRETGCKHGKALETVAKLHGWSSYRHAWKELGGAA